MKIIVLGGQGSGKSTQANLLAKELNIPHIEMGQLLRDKSKDNDDVADKIRQSLESGRLVSDEITTNTLTQKISNPPFNNGFVLDGYPRNNTQMTVLPRDIYKVFYIKVSDTEAIQRLLKRGRADDNKDLISKRLKIYHDQTEPLLDNFKKQNLLLEINGERTIKEIHTDIMSKIKSRQKNI
jgi:adenylate kinase